jgi:hypothetical protein
VKSVREKMIELLRNCRSEGRKWLMVNVQEMLECLDDVPRDVAELAAPPPQDPQSWFCPHCGCDRPQYTVLINNPVQMIGIGRIQTAALVCMGKLPGKDSAGGDILCRHALSLQVVNLQLDDALLASGRRRSPMEI